MEGIVSGDGVVEGGGGGWCCRESDGYSLPHYNPHCLRVL